ncbi:MAG TPA: VOC family protein [Solirubrobacteraceae bacterium]|nr:VOC family protein [Solirubrobacteraceae bacterium]
MSTEPIVDGPRPPHSTPVAPAQRIHSLIPFVHVEDVQRSIDFYAHLGLMLTSVKNYRGTPAWAALSSHDAELMVCTDGDSVDPAGQGILFYLYSADIEALREQLLDAGIDAGMIEDGPAGREMRLVDPDGYVLMIAQGDEAVAH